MHEYEDGDAQGDGAAPREEWLTRGQMAAVNCVSKKALLVYQEKGLLAPDRVDAATGYRYYSYEQCARLDAIRQLQGMGVPLADIGRVLDANDPSELERVVSAQALELARQAHELEIARSTAAHFLRTCRLMHDRPEVEVARLEWVPRQRIVLFPVEPYPFEAYQHGDNMRLRRWEKRLRAIKADFPRRGLPLVLFHNIGCVVDQASLASRRFVCNAGFVANEEGFGTGDPEYWEAGWHLTVTIDTLFYEGGLHAEHYWLCRLLDIADANGFTVCGHYHSASLLETPAFHYEGRDMMMRLYLPVDIHGVKPPYAGLNGERPEDTPRRDCRSR